MPSCIGITSNYFTLDVPLSTGGTFSLNEIPSNSFAGQSNSNYRNQKIFILLDSPINGSFLKQLLSGRYICYAFVDGLTLGQLDGQSYWENYKVPVFRPERDPGAYALTSSGGQTGQTLFGLYYFGQKISSPDEISITGLIGTGEQRGYMFDWDWRWYSFDLFFRFVDTVTGVSLETQQFV